MANELGIREEASQTAAERETASPNLRRPAKPLHDERGHPQLWPCYCPKNGLPGPGPAVDAKCKHVTSLLCPQERGGEQDSRQTSFFVI